MEQISHLIIQVSSSQVAAAEKRLDELGFSAKRAENATKGVTRASDGLTAGMLRLLGPLLSVGTAYAAFGKLFNTARQFEVLEAQLKTATGSADNAAIAFQAIQDFAKETPYDLAQATESFVALVNLGLTPSERALRSYGNTASALGRRMDEMVNAVAKATTGEFEPLKSFGVKARKEADGISFTFRGLTEKVRDDTRSIEDYFMRLGEANFGNSMQERMNTLDGAVSNLGDAWDQMFATISKAGAGELIERGVRGATAAIEELTAMIASGQLEGYIDAWIFKFDSLGEGVRNAVANITFMLEMAFEYWAGEGVNTANAIEDAFLYMPENIAAVVKAIGATLGLLSGIGDTVGRGLYDALIAWVNYGGKTIENLVKEIVDKVKDPLGEGTFDYTAEQAKAYHEFSSRVANDTVWMFEETQRLAESYGEVVTEVLNARDAAVASYDAQIEASKQRRVEYNLEIEARKMLNSIYGTDRLKQFGQGSGARLPSEEERRRFEALVDSLVSEEEAVQRSYDRRLQLIRDNTEEGSELRIQLEQELGTRMVSEMDSAHQARFDRLTEQYNAEQNALQMALDARQISESDFQAQSQQKWAQYTDSIKGISVSGSQTIFKVQQGMMADVLGRAADVSAQMASMAQEGSAAQKALFVTSKLLAMGQAFIMTELAAIAAMAPPPFGLGPVAGVPYSAAIRGLGYASIALMGAQTVMEVSQHEHGGMIPAGRFGIVGETGMPELVRGPAMVSSARTTADHGLAGSGGSSNVVVNVINNSGAEVTTEERNTDDGRIIDVVISRVRSEVARDIRTGGSAISSAMESTYRVRRGAA